METDFHTPAAHAPTARLGKIPWWALILMAGGLIILYQILASPDYKATFIFIKNGVIVTLRITMIAFPISTLIGLFVGLLRTSKSTFLFTISTLYVEIIRGIPLVVLILMAFETGSAGLPARLSTAVLLAPALWTRFRVPLGT